MRTEHSPIKRFVVEAVLTWTPLIVGVLLVRSLGAEPFRIPSGSMVPTLLIGDHIVVAKSAYGWRWPLTRVPLGTLRVPDRGDVIVFVFPGSDVGPAQWIDLPIPPFGTYDYVKRVVGLPGESVAVRDGQVWIDGRPQPQNLGDDYAFVDDTCTELPTRSATEVLGTHTFTSLRSTTYGARQDDFGPEIVPPGHVFVMGDNRDYSADSRTWGFVPLRNIKGEARMIWMSFEGCAPEGGQLRGRSFGLPRWERAGASVR
jgi:signal peptidase I